MSLPVSSEQLISVWGGGVDDEGKIKAFFCVFACERQKRETGGKHFVCRLGGEAEARTPT